MVFTKNFLSLRTSLLQLVEQQTRFVRFAEIFVLVNMSVVSMSGFIIILLLRVFEKVYLILIKLLLRGNYQNGPAKKFLIADDSIFNIAIGVVTCLLWQRSSFSQDCCLFFVIIVVKIVVKITCSCGRGPPFALLFLARAELESSFGFFTVNGWSCV